jgi:hypothetical protein
MVALLFVTDAGCVAKLETRTKQKTRPVRRKEAGEKLESLEGTRVYGFCFDLENGS